MKIMWMDGSYDSTWKVANARVGRRKIDWTDEVPQASIMMYDLSLSLDFDCGHLYVYHHAL